ncbi:MAG TPA: DUF885 family protein [Fimbriimonadaceae bacterium]|nr:DUF885 family protein [Fimbriimonadaceae bacterium]
MIYALSLACTPSPEPQTAPGTTSELRETIERLRADQGSLSRFYNIDASPKRRESLRQLYQAARKELDKLDHNRLSFDGAMDAALLRNHLDKNLAQFEIQQRQFDEIKDLVPFADRIIALEEARRQMEPLEPKKAADELHALTRELQELKKKVDGGLKAERHLADRAVATTGRLREHLKSWNTFYTGYDPLFTWWAREPYKALDKALEEYAAALREKVVGAKVDDKLAIVGNPIGREALMASLRYELIPYTPEELMKIGERELEWCRVEARKAARELGFGDDWRKALEHVKNLHVGPGEQPKLVRELALEAIEYLEKNELVTIPPLAKSTWRMEMMSAEAQKVNPFFLGGEQIIVAYPTDEMPHDLKLMSLRGNNRHFSRATVQHELIPGHHLQGFMTNRYKPYRELFRTPFWTEGWALYWEMLLWDLGFASTPEDRMGMLFWRMHRCVRILFSLGFHLGKLTPEECIEMLVNEVGHERSTAEGEVRRSFGGAYDPLYQAAYMVGGLQFRSLHRELVGSGKMTNRQFHDAILREGNIPVAAVRLILTRTRPPREFANDWRF